MLALFALAIQFTVAFGHIHLPRQLAPLGPSTVTASITLDGDAAGPVDKHHPASDVFCDICATLSLAAVGQLSAPPLLATPSSVVVMPESISSDAAPVQRRYLLAQSRGPPAV
jgi:hypothetical protein